jgi:hypothetical protein
MLKVLGAPPVPQVSITTAPGTSTGTRVTWRPHDAGGPDKFVDRDPPRLHLREDRGDLMLGDVAGEDRLKEFLGRRLGERAAGQKL